MSKSQTALCAALFTLLLGTGIYETRQVAALRTKVRLLQWQQQPLIEQFQQLTNYRTMTMQQLTVAQDENAALHRDRIKLQELREKLTRRQEAMNATNASLADPSKAKFPEWVDIHQRATASLWREGKLLLMKQHLQLTPEQQSAAQNFLERSNQNHDPANKYDFEAGLKSLLTPEQAQQYDELTAYRSRRDGPYAVTSQVAFDVAVLALQLGLNQTQQDKAFQAFAELAEARRQSELSYPAIQPNAGAADHTQVMAGYWINRRTELLKEVLSDEQFAIYERYAAQLLKAEQLQAEDK